METIQMPHLELPDFQRKITLFHSQFAAFSSFLAFKCENFGEDFQTCKIFSLFSAKNV